MSLPIHRSMIARIIRLSDEHGERDHAYISLAMRESVDEVKAPSASYYEWAKCAFGSLSTEEQYAAKLEAGIIMATDELSSYLADNTKWAFEEIPELDDTREILIATFS